MKKRMLSMLLIVAMLIPTLCCFPAEANADKVQEHTPIYLGYVDVDYGAELILKEIHTDGLTDREKIRAVYHWVVKNCQRQGSADTVYFDASQYASEIDAYTSQMKAEVNSGKASLRKEIASELYSGEMDDSDIALDCNWMVAYQAYSMMVYRVGNCLNYSALLAVLLGHLGFDCRIIGGNYINNDGSMVMHKWNCVLVDGEYYWLDVRMDHSWYTSLGSIYDRFFMITNKSAWQANHDWDERYSDWLFANAATVQNYIKPHAHTWDSGVLTRKMTNTQDGIVTYTCTGCGKTYTETLPAGGSPFVDVQDSSSYYYTPVLWAVDQGITTGTSDFAFSPTLGCSRAQLVTFLWRLAGEPEPTITDCSFRDVQPGAYYYDAVLWAVENHITNGLTDDTFGPDAAVSRCQAITFLWRLAGEPDAGTDSAVTFGDVPAGAYYYDAVAWGAKNGVVNGKSSAVFDPSAQVIRSDAVTFLYRYSQL